MKLIKRVAGILISLMMVFTILPVTAGADVEESNLVPYLCREWNASTKQVESSTAYINGDNVKEITPGDLTGWYIVNGYVDIKDRLYVQGKANLILADFSKLYCEEGINVSKGNTLNIYCQEGESGEMYCYADISDNAAIGADDEKGDCGTINIYGGYITADTKTKGTDGAGIGGGDEGNGGTVTIYGGSVTAIGGKYGAGIGGGDADGVGGEGGTTIIYGGTVNATGGTDAAGIGGGEEGNGGACEIWGGTVTATGTDAGAGIGGGENGASGKITIYGGEVTATSTEDGAGIGGGENGACGAIVIHGGEVTATSAGKGSAIGNGRRGAKGTPFLGNVRVTSGSSEQSAELQTAWKRVDGCSMTYAKVYSCPEHVFRGKAVSNNDFTHSFHCFYCYYSDEDHKSDHHLEVRWKWAEDFSSAKATISCPDCNLTKEITASGNQISLRVIKAPTYLEDGEGKYTATVTFLEKEYKSSTIGPIPKLSRDVQAIYTDLDGNEQAVSATVLGGDETDLKNGWYLVNDDITFNNRISINGKVNLILGDGAVMNASQGISVVDGQELTIWGQAEGSGKLIARSSQDYVAGIGGWEGPSGQIVINGGNVEASGARCGAGIGGGGKSQYGQPGYVTINGGNVKAVGGYGAAGIGAGGFYYDGAGDSGGTGTVVINGGTVDAAGGDAYGGAAIGGGRYGRGYVTINGGSIKAGSGGIGDGTLGYGRSAETPLGQVTLNYGDKGCVVYSTEYVRVNVTLLKPFTDGTNTYEADTYGVDDKRKFNDKTLYAPGTVQVEWKNDDGTLLKKDGIPSGSVPAYSGVKPTKAADEHYTYTFAGWTPEITAITENTSYTATIEKTPKIITLDNPCGKVTSNVESAKSGDTVTLYLDPETGYRVKDVWVSTIAQDKTSVPLKALNGQGGTGQEGYPKLIDGNINTKWYTEFNGSNYIIFKADSKVSMDAYALTTANDTGEYGGRNWKDWTIYGANFKSDSEAVRDSGEWQVITSVKNDNKLPAASFVQCDYVLNKPADAYQYYMIVVTAKGGSDQFGNNIQMAEFTLYDKYRGEQVKVSGSGDTRTFTMPDKPVFVGAEFDSVFVGYNLSLGGDIGLIYYLNITDREAENNSVVFHWSYIADGEVRNKSYSCEPLWDGEDGLYIAVCPVSAAEMIYGINASVIVGGETYTDNYAVFRFADTILTGEGFARSYIAHENAKGNNGEERLGQLRMFIKTMLDYGSWAQVYFVRNPETLVNSEFVTDDPTSPYYYVPEEVTADMINTGSSDMYAGLDAYGLEYKGSTLVYLSETSLRHYYKITDQAKFDAVKDSITFNGEKCGFTLKDDLICFEHKDIAAPELDTLFTLKIGNSAYKYSALDYVKECLTSKDSSESLKNLAKATYRYNKAADVFFDTKASVAKGSSSLKGSSSEESTAGVMFSAKTTKALSAEAAPEEQSIDTNEYETLLLRAKADNPIKVTAKKTVKAKASKKTVIKNAVKVKKAQGTVTYKTNNKKVTVKKGNIIVAKGLKKGKTYKVKIKVTAKGNKNYKKGTKTVTVNVKVQ